MSIDPGWAAPGERPSRIGFFFIAIWTFFLLQPLHAGWDRRHTAAGWVGIVGVLVFAALYLAVFARSRAKMRRLDPAMPVMGEAFLATGAAVALAVVICLAVGQAGTATSVYIAVLFIITLPSRIGVPLALLNAAAFFVAGFVVPHWTSDPGLLLSDLAASLAVFGITQMLLRQAALETMREDNLRLAVGEERNRFARDLHDILGHSLTVITVKAELAQRLLDVDVERTRAELVDLERLSRDALFDVRRAVEGYRELTLPGELARARTALQAAEIEALLPNSTDEVPSQLRDLFAWVVREGVTNVLRHSGARTCSVTLSPDAVEVRDDGTGPGDSSLGSGLLGLQERASAVGGAVITRALDPGYSLRVVVS